jgi:hypothetical protein
VVGEELSLSSQYSVTRHHGQVSRRRVPKLAYQRTGGEVVDPSRAGKHRGVGESDTPRDISRCTVPEAAQASGVSSEAVRNRLSRGTLKSVKEAGTVYVLLVTDRTRHTGDRPNDRSTDTPPGWSTRFRRIDSLKQQLERANERDRENRRIIAALTSRIPAIEASSEAPGAPETTVGEPERAERASARKLRGSGGRAEALVA